MAYLVGVLLVVLVLIGMPLKYFVDNGSVGDLDRCAAWLALHDSAGDRLRPRPPRPLAPGRLLIIALAGTVPFLLLGRVPARNDVQDRLRDAEPGLAAAEDRTAGQTRRRGIGGVSP